MGQEHAKAFGVHRQLVKVPAGEENAVTFPVLIAMAAVPADAFHQDHDPRIGGLQAGRSEIELFVVGGSLESWTCFVVDFRRSGHCATKNP